MCHHYYIFVQASFWKAGFCLSEQGKVLIQIVREAIKKNLPGGGIPPALNLSFLSFDILNFVLKLGISKTPL